MSDVRNWIWSRISSLRLRVSLPVGIMLLEVLLSANLLGRFCMRFPEAGMGRCTLPTRRCVFWRARELDARRVSLTLQSSTPLTRSRLATVNSSSTQPTPVQLPPPFVPSLNRNLGNLNVYGNKSSQHSRKGTKKPRRMKNSRLRIVNVRKLERGRQMVSNGYRVTLDRWTWRGVRRNSWILC
jgi:hypothetical protein